MLFKFYFSLFFHLKYNAFSIKLDTEIVETRKVRRDTEVQIVRTKEQKAKGGEIDK